MRMVCLTLIFFANPLVWLVVWCVWKPSPGTRERKEDQAQANDLVKGLLSVFAIVTAVGFIIMISIN
ncbi:hypothetical protein LP7551_03894 [Roseibium album]|nr:hypothetical protein LP7551_03894 [Roseibium album]